MLCILCKSETNNPKFCSRSCAAIHNNKIDPNRKRMKPQGKCKQCNKTISKNRVYCSECKRTPKLITELTTLKEVTYTGNGVCNNFSYVRSLARQIAKSLGWTSCSKCGYNKHVEIAHIKALSDFDENTLLKVVNDPSNLLALCPNCHWEFDNLQKVAEVGSAPTV